jgi:hypothetical protein
MWRADGLSAGQRSPSRGIARDTEVPWTLELAALEMRAAEISSVCDGCEACDAKLVQAEIARACSGVKLLWLPEACNLGWIAMKILLLKVYSVKRYDR